MNEERQQEIERANKRIAELQHKWETNQEFRYHWDRIMARSQNDKGKSPKQLYPNPFEALGWKGKMSDQQKLDQMLEAVEPNQEKNIVGARNAQHNQTYKEKIYTILNDWKNKP